MGEKPTGAWKGGLVGALVVGLALWGDSDGLPGPRRGRRLSRGDGRVASPPDAAHAPREPLAAGHPTASAVMTARVGAEIRGANCGKWDICQILAK
jgi:hypothetical protein